MNVVTVREGTGKILDLFRLRMNFAARCNSMWCL